MPARSLADLQDSCQTSQAELLRIRKEIQNAGKRKRRAEKTALQEHRPLTAFMKIAAVLVFVLADHTVEVATAFAIGKGRKRRRLLHDADDVQAQIELEYINMPTDKVVDLLSEPLTPQIQRLIIPASKHAVEHRLFQWVVDQNCEKGVAPSGRLMLQEGMKVIPATAPGHVRQRPNEHVWLPGKVFKEMVGQLSTQVGGSATTYFCWANYVRSCVPVGKRTLMINMDETALAYSWAGLPNGRSLRTEQASRNDMRRNVTHLAFICDDSSIQPLLPQILLGNHSKFTIRLLNSVAGQLPPNLHLWRQDSSWNSHSTMRKALGILRRALQPIASTHSIILILDMARVHMHHTIYQHAKQCGTRLLYVPARLTWLLQPCDTHLFARFKNELRRRWHEERCQSESGIISSAGWLHIIASYPCRDSGQ
ncbi:unnamed protein product [Polarella glacialis]|uniref:DDE-1 domain-containing protein n=1 Tax=Polarella glacialis TaxID=89957 RepID=A0A813FUX7_POLGL|nr:unnamed protein product [Polarella glacialis]